MSMSAAAGSTPVLPVVAQISDPGHVAVTAVLDRYAFLHRMNHLVQPESTIEPHGDGWIVTVWLGPSLYKRVAVRQGTARLLESDQPV